MIFVTNKAIEHVKETEATIDKIRQEAHEKINKINEEKEREMERIDEELKNNIRAFKIEQREQFEQKLKQRVSTRKNEVSDEANKYQKTYESKKDELSSYIVREVLKRYGSK